MRRQGEGRGRFETNHLWGFAEVACSAGVPCHEQPRPPPSTRHPTLAPARSAQGTSAFKHLPQNRSRGARPILRRRDRRGKSSIPGILKPKSREARPPNAGSRDSGLENRSPRRMAEAMPPDISIQAAAFGERGLDLSSCPGSPSLKGGTESASNEARVRGRLGSGADDAQGNTELRPHRFRGSPDLCGKPHPIQIRSS